MEEYTKEQLQELYGQLPKDLQDAVYSNKIGELVRDACQKNGLQDSFTNILKQVGYVFLGILPPDEFKKVLNNPAVFSKLNNEIFFNLKNSLDPLYGIKLEKVPEAKHAPAAEKKPVPQQPKGENGSDRYLEPLE